MDNKRACRLGIVQRVLVPYRVPFFLKLAGLQDLDASLFAGQPMVDETIRTVTAADGLECFTTTNRYWPRRTGTLIWQQDLVGWLEQVDPEVLLVEANPRMVSHWRAIRWMHSRGRPVVGWGLGELPRTGHSCLITLRQRGAHRLFSAFDGIVAYSTKARRDYLAAGVPSDSIFVAHNAIDDSESEQYIQSLSGTNWRPIWRKEMQLDPRLPIVLFVGRLTQQKRVDLLIRACSPLHQRCQILVVGEGSIRSELEQLARAFPTRVRFAGHQTGESLACSFLGSDVFVLPAAGGLALHQAMSYGLPVIASFGDGTEADLVRDGLNGFIFEADRADSLTEKLTFLLSDPDRAREMGQASLSIVRDEINIERMVASVKRAIDTVVGRGEHSL